jgi:hypothetical protein
MEPTRQAPQIQLQTRIVVPEAPNQVIPPVCVLGRQVPVRWLKTSTTTVQVRRLD